ncbi:glycosyltransferase family 2 protein [Sunxiuqinia sp. A32]|uniref:glycosyltransferase family 2 protein n=1 Tax=Sunxiuqinia sp. A32 TaxID=3461496 RepID=UPI00404658E7
MIKIFFLILLIVVFYTYVGYALLLWFLVIIKRSPKEEEKVQNVKNRELPRVCMFVTAYNEVEYVDQKVNNTYSLNYPKDRLQYLWLTDGSNDGTPELLKKYPHIQVQHQIERKGKINAMNRGMNYVQAPIIIFSDSNTVLAKDTIIEIVEQFEDPKVGCVAGEKRIVDQKDDNAAGSGESIYWQFESFIKNMDSQLNSAIGAVGELFAIRRELYEEIENDTLLDDFIISLQIAKKGYRIAYTPKAYAIESASVNVKEELKRKSRIASGGIQTVIRMPELLNPFKYGLLSFQYISHKVLRWTIAPFALFLLFIINFLILAQANLWFETTFYTLFFYLQLIMYFAAIIGWIIENQKLKLKFFFIPYYFTAMNYASIKGIFRYLLGLQSVVWEKSKRA